MKKLLSVFVFLLASQLQVLAQGNPVNFAGFYLANQPIDPSRIIELFAGDTLKLEWHGTATNPNDSLSLSSDISSVLPGASFSANNGNSASAYFHWVPAATDVSFIPYEIALKVDDNQKPIRGIQHLPLKIRVNGPQTITLNNGPVNLNREIQLQPGDPFNFRLSSVNANTGNAITVTSNATSVLPGAVFTTNNATQQTASINWTPTAAHVSQNPYVFTVTLHDNSAATPKQSVYTVRLRVGNIMAVHPERQVNSDFTAFPNPFTESVTFRFKAQNKTESILIYNLLGQQIDAIAVSKSVSGEQQFTWQNAARHAAGTYVAKLVAADNTIETLKFVKLQ